MYWEGKRIIHKQFGKGIVICDTNGEKLVRFDNKPPKNVGMYVCTPDFKDYEYVRWVYKKDFKKIDDKAGDN